MLKILIAEDDFASRMYLSKFLSRFGECDAVTDGLAAIEAYTACFREKKPYDLICLDIMMPKVDGVTVLKSIRDLETRQGTLPEKRVKVIITTALSRTELVQTAFEYGCEAYALKPIDIENLMQIIKDLGLIR